MSGLRVTGVAAFASLLLVAVLASPAGAQQPEFAPERVKAAFLYNFGAYVEWPPSAVASPELKIAVIGAESVATELRRISSGRTIQGRVVKVIELSSVSDIEDAQIVFVGHASEPNLRRVLSALRERPVLTVTESPDALKLGSIINFAIIERRVRFEASLASARVAGLELSSRLLAIALRVERNGGVFDEIHDERSDQTEFALDRARARSVLYGAGNRPRRRAELQTG